LLLEGWSAREESTVVLTFGLAYWEEVLIDNWELNLLFRKSLNELAWSGLNDSHIDLVHFIDILYNLVNFHPDLETVHVGEIVTEWNNHVSVVL
jgi:hypothetical protein